jgi:ABC-2 type transport system permease protein
VQTEVNVTHYLALWLQFAKTSLIREISYRLNFIIDLIIEVAWTGVMLFTLTILFSKTQSLGGWTQAEVMLLYGIYKTASSLTSILVLNGTRSFSMLVNTGELDLLISKPANTLFMAMMRMIAVNRSSQLLTSLMLVLYALNLTTPINPIKIPLLLLMVFLATCIKSAWEIIIVLPSFWLHKLQNSQELSLTLFAVARFPRQAFSQSFALVFSLLFPVFFTGSYPSEIILGKLPLSATWLVAITALTSILLMTLLFKLGMRSYQSASS